MSVRGAGDDAARTHITLLHTPQFHRPTHVRCRVTNRRIPVRTGGGRPTARGRGRFADSGPGSRERDTPRSPRPSPAPRPDTRVRPPRPRSGRRGRATARSSVQRDACPRDERRGNAARGRAAEGRRGQARRADPPGRKGKRRISYYVMARSLLQFSHGIPTI